MSTRRAALIASLLAVVLIAFGAIAIRSRRQPTVRFSIAAGTINPDAQPIMPATGSWPYSQRIAYDWGLADEVGVDYQLVPRVNGKGTIATLLDGNADIAVVASAALVMSIARGDDVLVLAETERSYNQMSLVARAEHAADWIDMPIGYVAGTALESVLLAELRQAGRLNQLRDGKLDLVGAQRTETLVDSLVVGTTGSATMLQPTARLLTSSQAGPSEFVNVASPGLYEFTSYMVTTRNRWDANREGILLAMRATKASRDIIQQDPERRLWEIHNHEAGTTELKDTPPLFWSKDEVVFITDSETIGAALTAEAELRVEAGLIDAVPDFSEALSAVAEVGRAA